MFEYFYNEILRKTIIAFGTMFNNISIKHLDSSNNVLDVVKVPLAYGPTQKFLARLEQSPDLNKSTAITLPRMSFEFNGLSYDSSRKVTTTQQFVSIDSEDGSECKKTYMPVPYTMQFELSIMAKVNDDMLQIIEQILPYFQPAYNISIELVDGIKEKRDIPIVLDNITMQDDYTGDFTSRRVLLYTLKFNAKTYLFGPVTSASKDIIKKATINYLEGRSSTSAVRGLSYSVSPRAIKDYNGDIVTIVSKDIDASTTIIEVDDSSVLTEDSYIDIEGEQIYIKTISDSKVLVDRGRDKTIVTSHLRGAAVKIINQQDDVLVEEGDDFGFNGDIF